MNRLYPRFQNLAPEEIYSDLAFPPPSADRPYVVINMVTTVDGKATSSTGKSSSLGSALDRLAMRRIRCAVDAVMCGAETLRRENVKPGVPKEMEAGRIARGFSPQPIALTVTASGNLPLDRSYFRSTAFERVVVTVESAPEERVAALALHARIVRAGENAVDLPLMMKFLVEQLGIRRLLVEGGPTMNAELISLGLADELFWTVAPKILGGTGGRTMVEGIPLRPENGPGMQLVSIHEHESELFLRYRLPTVTSR